jgi:hypothetical protein
MPCDTVLRENETKAQRSARADAATKRLEEALTAGRARVVIGPNGALAFVGWDGEERDGVADVCAYRRLTNARSWPLRQAIARAETSSGRKLTERAVAAGVHSHDGGKTWGSH